MSSQHVTSLSTELVRDAHIGSASWCTLIPIQHCPDRTESWYLKPSFPVGAFLFVSGTQHFSVLHVIIRENYSFHRYCKKKPCPQGTYIVGGRRETKIKVIYIIYYKIVCILLCICYVIHICTQYVFAMEKSRRKIGQP